MVACAFARGCARVLVCAFVMGAASAAAQETAEPDAAAASETSEASGAADAADGDNKTKNSAALPGLVVETSPKPAEKKAAKKNKGTTTAAAPAAAGEDTQPEVPGIVYGQALSDTGTTTFDANSVNLRTDGGGDANTFLRNLPNVQYQDDTDESPGVNLYDLINTRPLEVSINGARKYENNFILNGVSINSVAGPETFDVDDLQSDTDEVPNLNGFYGLHSQTVYVPSEFIGTATLIDSNASAEYGEFQGGVVIYDLAKPPTDRYRASASYSRQTHEMVDYILATESGANTLNRIAPTFTKENLAASVGAPITTDLSFILQASRKTAETRKQKDYELSDAMVEDNSSNVFLRFATSLKTEIGTFTLDSSHTDYSQVWQSPGWLDLDMDVTTKSSTTKIEYLGALPSISATAIGLSGVTLKAQTYYNDSETGNYTGENEAHAYTIRRSKKVNGVWQETFSTDDQESWCRYNPDEAASSTATQNNTICYRGGYGDKEMGQTDIGAIAQLRGKVLLGNFLIGGEAKSIEGRRARLGDFTYYSSYATSSGDSASYTPPSGSYDCQGADNCSEDSFAKTKIVSKAFDIEQTVNALHGYAELDQTLWWFNVRAGARIDYEDYFKNINIAPRLTGTITPIKGLSFTGGYNRYYMGETLYYALRDAQPFAETYTRKLVSGTDTPAEWVAASTGRIYTFSSSDLSTPYSDEYTGAVNIRDPFLGGNVRLKYLERYGRDQFASVDCGTNCLELTNDGERFYRSASAEYAKFWRTPNTPYLSGGGFTLGATWSEQSISRSTFFDTDEDDERIYYKGDSYTKESFTAVSGNLDIPIRIEATLTTSWFNDILVLGLNAGYNLGYQGVYDTGEEIDFEGRTHTVYLDKSFNPVLQLDLTAEIAVTEQAYISARVNNVLNTAGNAVTTSQNPWLIGRSFWIESGLRF